MRTGREAGRLTAHALDLARARPAQGVRIEVYRVRGDRGADQGADQGAAGRGEGKSGERVARAWTNADGRLDEPLIAGGAFVEGVYDLVFHAGEYWSNTGWPGPGPILEVSVRLRVSDAGGHYHLPLLLSPGGVSVYRGS